MAKDFSPGVPGSPRSGLQWGGSRLGSLGLRVSAGRHRQAQAQPMLVGEGKARLTPNWLAAPVQQRNRPPRPA